MGWMTDALEAKRQEREDELLRSATHEAGHAVLNHLAGARVLSISVVQSEVRAGRTTTSFAGVDLADVMVGFSAGAAALAVLGWPNPEQGAEEDQRCARLVAMQLAHLKGRDKATDPEYLDAVVDAGRREAHRLASEHWEAIAAVAKILVRDVRVGGDEEVGALIDHALLKVPAYAAREAAFTRQWDQAMVTLGFARPLRA